MALLTTIIGYSASLAGMSIMIPQVIKTIRTKSAKDLSWVMMVLFFVNCILWVVYGALIRDIPVMVTNSWVVAVLIIQSILKARYERKAPTVEQY